MSDFHALWSLVLQGDPLTKDQASDLMKGVLEGRLTTDQMVTWLGLWRDRGETPDEVAGVVCALRNKMQPLPIKSVDVVDTCGTGGDGLHTFNISTAAAFVVAGAGVCVAKHGNRAVSSRAGSADVLRELGVNIEASPEVVAHCVDTVGIGFLFAPSYHTTLKVVAEARKKLGTKSIFNIVGPLLNPAGAKKQVIGVYDKRLLGLIACVLRDLGSARVAVVHGNDGLDEVTLTTTSQICFLKEGKLFYESFDPKGVGYSLCQLKDLQGGDAQTNAKRLKQCLKGDSQPLDHCVHLNAALALLVADVVPTFTDGLIKAQKSIASGQAYQKLEALIDVSNQTL